MNDIPKPPPLPPRGGETPAVKPVTVNPEPNTQPVQPTLPPSAATSMPPQLPPTPPSLPQPSNPSLPPSTSTGAPKIPTVSPSTPKQPSEGAGATVTPDKTETDGVLAPKIKPATVEPAAPTVKPSEITFEIDEEVEYKPTQTFNPQSASFATTNEDKAAVVASYGSNDDDGDEYLQDYEYQNAGQTVVMGSSSILPKIFKPLLWIGVIAGLAAAGWFLYPYFTTWYNMVFPEETTSETDSLQPIDANNATQSPPIDDQFFNIGALTGQTITVPYTLSGTQTVVNIEVQLEGIERATDFGALLEVAKVDLRGKAPEVLTEAQITELINQYRFSYVRINMTYQGEPITPAPGQAALQIRPVQDDQNPIADAAGSIRSHYIVNISQGNTEAGIRYLIQNQNCNLSETIPDSFWQGNYSIQQCYIFLSPQGFNSVLIPHSSLDEPIRLEAAYKD
jgi:hypothetical protein